VGEAELSTQLRTHAQDPMDPRPCGGLLPPTPPRPPRVRGGQAPRWHLRPARLLPMRRGLLVAQCFWHNNLKLDLMGSCFKFFAKRVFSAN
jgi:hypothetical protein